jgi:hypothetical protein
VADPLGLLRRYRASGADLPCGDPARAHGTALEGYYWRIVQPATGRVVVALCGVCDGPRGPWALVTLAAHPGRFARSAVWEHAAPDPRGFGVRAGRVLDGGADRVAVDLGDAARLDVRLHDAVPFPRRALGGLGPAQVVPGLPQYWHPVVLAARVEGSARAGSETVDLDGATAYAEKNWGRAFPGRWWWGHAGAFDDPDVSVAFAGGPIRVAGQWVAPTTVVVRLGGGEVLRLTPPGARTRVAAGDGAWRVVARSARAAVDVEGTADGVAPHELDVPVPHELRTERRSRQILAGRLAVCVRRRGRVVFRGESPLAGLELGGPASTG